MIWTCAGRSQQISSLSPLPLGHDYLRAKIIVVAIWDEAVYLLFDINKGSERIWTTDLSICSRMLYHWGTLPGMESSNYPMSSTHDSHFFTLNQVLVQDVFKQIQFNYPVPTTWNIQRKDMIFTSSNNKNLIWNCCWYSLELRLKLCSHLEKIGSTRLNLFR